MGLWTVVPERLQSSMCSLYKVPLQLVEQGAKETVSVIQKPVDTLDEFVPDLKSGNTANESTNRNSEKTNKEESTQDKTNGKLPKVPIPRIPFTG